MINPGLNVNLFEINTGNVFYKNVPLERTPWISALVQLNGNVINNRGQCVATCAKGSTGEYNISWQSIPYPSGGADYIVHLTPLEGEVFIYASNRQNLQVRVVTTARTGGGADCPFFITIY